MPRPTRPWRCGAPLALALAVGLAALGECRPARADLIFLKDGTVLQGRIRRETKLEFDPVTHEPIQIPQGFFLVDDGPRRIYFPQSQVGRLVSQKEGQTEERISYPREFTVPTVPVPPIHEVVEVTPFDAKWDRKIRVRSGGKADLVPQHLHTLTPQYANVNAVKHYAWPSYYLLRELGPEVVQQLLATHPQLTESKEYLPKGKEELRPDELAARRFRVFTFYLQAGWFDPAQEVLGRIARDLPEERARLEEARALLGKVRAREVLEEAKRRHLAGQSEAVRRLLADFPEKDAAEEVAAEARELRASVDAAAERLAEARRHLTRLAEEVKNVGGPPALAMAAWVIAGELHPDRLGRLDAFLGQAQQAERQRQAGRTPEVGPASLVSLAVTGWLLGNPAAEAKPETAVRLWRARELVLAYLRAATEPERQRLLAAYLRDKDEQARLDEVCQMIPQLPPAEPEPVPTTAAAEMRAGGAGRRSVVYQLKLPPEYTHNRPYPVLLALPPSTEKPAQTVHRWADACAENGYILAVPEWSDGSGGYGYSEREHGVVFEVLRDLRRRFQVDSDRVFLTGLYDGGIMAYDVALSHPDLFAGVVPMASAPYYFAEAYWRSSQYLPFYVVTGDRAGGSEKHVREQFTSWVQRGFPNLWVQYKGRGLEWYGGEVPGIFDWMRNKRRAFPLQQLGSDGNGGSFGTEFYSMRQSDNRFYWVTLGAIAERSCNSPDRWNSHVLPARLSGRIDPAGNEVLLRTYNVKQLTVWLGRNGKGESMVDFDRPVIVRVNVTQIGAARKVVPSLETLLRDLRDRGDRQQLFLAKIDLNL
jgi:hypothetical protein